MTKRKIEVVDSVKYVPVDKNTNIVRPIYETVGEDKVICKHTRKTVKKVKNNFINKVYAKKFKVFL